MSTNRQPSPKEETKSDKLPCPVKSPSSQRKQKQRKSSPRSTFTQEELRTFEACFRKNPLPSGEVLSLIAAQLGLRREVVRVWFQNRRAKARRLQNAVEKTLASDESFESPWKMSMGDEMASGGGQEEDGSIGEPSSCSPKWESTKTDRHRASAFVRWRKSPDNCESSISGGSPGLALTFTSYEGVATSNWCMADVLCDSSSFLSPHLNLNALRAAGKVDAEMRPSVVDKESEQQENPCPLSGSPSAQSRAICSPESVPQLRSAEREHLRPVYTSVIRAGPDYHRTSSSVAQMRTTEQQMHLLVTAEHLSDDGQTASASPVARQPPSPSSSSSGVSSASRSMTLDLAHNSKRPRQSESGYSDCDLNCTQRVSLQRDTDSFLPITSRTRILHSREPQNEEASFALRTQTNGMPDCSPSEMRLSRQAAQIVGDDKKAMGSILVRPEPTCHLSLPLLRACAPCTYFSPPQLPPVEFVANPAASGLCFVPSMIHRSSHAA